MRAGFCCTSVSRTAASSGELTGLSSASSGSGTAVGGGSAGASAVSIGSPSAIRSYAARKSVSSSKSEAWLVSQKKASVLAPFCERKVVATSSVCHHGNRSVGVACACTLCTKHVMYSVYSGHTGFQ